MEFLQDFTFLQKLNKYKVKEYWAAIMVLDFSTERPLQRIEGKVVSGNISIAANSPVRRSGTLTVVFDEGFRDITNINNIIAIDKKIAISIGITNPYYDTQEYRQYGDILWFKQGTFILTKASSSISATTSSISINFVDKMALLNGTCGGVLPATVSFHDMLITEQDGTTTTDYPLISQIILEAVHHYGGEHPSKIVVSDIEDVGRQVVTYQGGTPINFQTYKDVNDVIRRQGGNFVIGNPPIENFADTYYKGDIVGYLETPLTYPGELIMKAGATVTQVLDAIVDALGNYEYFYDTEGVFHFQKIKNYLATGNAPLNFNAQADETLDNSDNKTSLSSNEDLQIGYLPKFQADAYFNEFSDTHLVTQVNFSPQYEKIKNDFIVWGTRNSNEENAQLVRYHLTIDERPKDTPEALCHQNIYMVYQPYEKINEDGTTTIDEDDGVPVRYQTDPVIVDNVYGYKIKQVCRPLKECFPNLDSWYHFNWREELYRMALINYGASTDTLIMSDGSLYSGYAYYYEELRAEWRDIYDPESSIKNTTDSFQAGWEDYYGISSQNPWFGYNVNVAKDPSKLRYWLDILDSNGTIGQFSIKRIGRRTIAKENSKINEIFASDINDIVFIDASNEDWKYKEVLGEEGIQGRIKYYNSIGQTYCLLGKNHMPYFSVRNSYGTCYDDIRELLYTNLVYNSSVTLTSIPLLYFDVNRIVRLNFPEQKIQGDYVINQISWQFGKIATMNLSLQEALVIS